MENLAIIKIAAHGQQHVIAGPTRNDAIQKAVELLGLKIEMLDADQALLALADGATFTMAKGEPATAGTSAETTHTAAPQAAPTHGSGGPTPDMGAAINKLED